MTGADRLSLRVPGSSANLGPGFDSIGLAINLFLEVEAERSSQWEVVPLSEELKKFPSNEENFIIQTALKAAKFYGAEMPPCRLEVKSEIPLARGLGSSAAAIIAGIELADCFCHLNLSKKQKLELAAKLEGHPDNVGASLYGGLVVGSQLGDDVDVTWIHSFDVEAVAVIPQTELMTKVSRQVLPAQFDYAHAVQASAVANQLVAALLTGNWLLAGKMMRSDLFHQPYRKALVPNFERVEVCAEQNGAFGAAISGAGPTVICFTENGKGAALAAALSKEFTDMLILPLKIDKAGSTACQTDQVKNN
ncbi:homoserine kinase [Mesobacillus harenae]|uniref:homoserine kinase n=1 Tax=Mesobacillus harenae TaxID=2213203 RepID=UPI0015800746|nr:homoserine kinase [Mesobacillus harenae]